MNILSIQPIEGLIALLILGILILVFSYISRKADKLKQESHEIETEITEVTMDQRIAEEAENLYNGLSSLRYRLECSSHPRKQIYMGELRQAMGYLYDIYGEYKYPPQEEPEPNEPGIPTLDRYQNHHWDPQH